MGGIGAGRPALWSTRLDVGRVARIVWGTATALVVLDLVVNVSQGPLRVPWQVMRMLDGDQKLNLPTGYKTTMLLTVTLLLFAQAAVAGRDGEPTARGWSLLGAGAAFAFFDETTYLHQSMTEAINRRVDLGPALHFGWVVVYLPVAGAVGVVAVRFLCRLRSGLTMRLVGGGVLYGIGAVAMTPLRSVAADRYGLDGAPFRLISVVADSAEMMGLALLVTALLAELARRVSVLSVTLVHQPARGSGPGIASRSVSEL